MSTPAVLRAEAVSFRYPQGAREAVCGASIEVRAGDLVAVAGPNGSGKSTLLGLLVGFLPPARGSVTLDGHPIGSIPRVELARRVTAIPQGEVPLPGMTVRELVLLGRIPHAAGWLPVPSREDERAADGALGAVGLGGLEHRRVETLSGGERQLARIARALAQGAGLMLLDEPTAALDLAHQQQVMRLLRRLREESGLGILVVTHDLNLASNWADRIVLMRRGEVAAEGEPARIVAEECLRPVFGAELWSARAPDGAPFVGLRR